MRINRRIILSPVHDPVTLCKGLDVDQSLRLVKIHFDDLRFFRTYDHIIFILILIYKQDVALDLISISYLRKAVNVIGHRRQQIFLTAFYG